jgi:hypothetical protein
MPDAFAMSFNCPNYSGMLFNKGNTRTPLSAIIGSRQKVTNHVEFVTGQSFTSGGGSQPNISESASLTAPDATIVTRSQDTNVTQIFQETLGVSYAKESNMGTLSGVNVANQTANPMSELDFQVAAKMLKIARDIEYTFINGTYNKATADTEVNKTRGLANAITTNVKAMGGKPLGLWDVCDILKAIYDSNAPTTGLCIWCDATTLFQLNADAQQNGLTVVPASREINGISLSSIVTPLGTVYIYLGEFLPAGTAFVLNLDVIAPVNQPTPGKGNFFLEELAKVGAGTKYQIFGQVGLDYGPEWYHGKITGISTDFVAPEGKKIVIAGPSGPVGTIDTRNSIVGVALDKTSVAASDTATVAVTSVSYNIMPETDPSLAYLWQVRAKTGTVWTDLTSSYTGYNTATLTVKAADAEKHYRCKITATGSVADVAYSPECDVEAAASNG